MSARKWQIFTDIYGLVKPKIPIESWAKGAIVEAKFSKKFTLVIRIYIDGVA